MDAFIHASPFTGYVYPNETIIPWTVLIVVYPYLTGLVAGAFTISSLYQVFGFTQLRPVAHFALLVSLCCMLTVPLPLLLHLGHPERAFNAMITPHVTSAFAVFGYAAGFYIHFTYPGDLVCISTPHRAAGASNGPGSCAGSTASCRSDPTTCPRRR